MSNVFDSRFDAGYIKISSKSENQKSEKLKSILTEEENRDKIVNAVAKLRMSVGRRTRTASEKKLLTEKRYCVII